MPRRQPKKPDWTPATKFKVIKLRANGPKPGQATSAWLYGKQREEAEFQKRKRQQPPSWWP